MSEETRRQRLDAAMRKKAPKVRLDSALTDRQVALNLLAAMRVDADTHRPGGGDTVAQRSDAYVCEYALAKAGDLRPADEAEAAHLERISNWRRR